MMTALCEMTGWKKRGVMSPYTLTLLNKFWLYGYFFKDKSECFAFATKLILLGKLVSFQENDDNNVCNDWKE